MIKNYQVQWIYKSSLGGPWGPGRVVSLTPEEAEAINKSSPGVLVEQVHQPERSGPMHPPTRTRRKTAVKSRRKK